MYLARLDFQMISSFYFSCHFTDLLDQAGEKYFVHHRYEMQLQHGKKTPVIHIIDAIANDDGSLAVEMYI